MRRLIAVAVAVVCAFIGVRLAQDGRVATAPARSAPVAPAPAPASAPAPPTTSASGNSSVARAAANHARDVPVDGSGRVSRLLSDDNQGDRHQRFLVRLASGESILIVHNIDIAPRVANLRVGDDVQFEGEYVWNDKGGLVHWTHHDPSGRHKTGWLKHAGRTYQ